MKVLQMKNHWNMLDGHWNNYLHQIQKKQNIFLLWISVETHDQVAGNIVLFFLLLLFKTKDVFPHWHELNHIRSIPWYWCCYFAMLNNILRSFATHKTVGPSGGSMLVSLWLPANHEFLKIKVIPSYAVYQKNNLLNCSLITAV